jgi:predicted RNase H-like HicB family nuclease
MAELVFEAVQEADGGYCAECLTENIFTQGSSWEELRQNVIEATAGYFFDRPKPERIRLQSPVADQICLTREDILACLSYAS